MIWWILLVHFDTARTVWYLLLMLLMVSIYLNINVDVHEFLRLLLSIFNEDALLSLVQEIIWLKDVWLLKLWVLLLIGFICPFFMLRVLTVSLCTLILKCLIKSPIEFLVLEICLISLRIALIFRLLLICKFHFLNRVKFLSIPFLSFFISTQILFRLLFQIDLRHLILHGCSNHARQQLLANNLI